MKEMKKLSEEIVISIKTDVPVATYITKKLLEKVAKKEIEFDIQAREGSVDVQFILGFIGGYSASLLSNITWDIVKRIWKKLKREGDLGREPSPGTVEVRELNLEKMVTGQEDLEELRRKFHLTQH